MKTCRKPRPRLLLIISLALACLLVVETDPVHAATITVNTITDELDGDCGDGDCSLRDAIALAAADDTVDFTIALSGQTIFLTIGQLDIDKNLTINGSSLASHISISGNHAVRAFFIYSGAMVTLTHLDIVDGLASVSSGGGIENYGDLTLNNCTLSGNSADWGGGIFNAGTLTVNRCTFSSNTTTGNGGGLLNEFGGTVTVTDSTFTGNTGAYGGGIRNQSSLTVVGGTFEDNTADWGGATDNYNGELTVEGTTFRHNTGNYEGGGILSGAKLTVTGGTFEDNSSGAGGGVYCHNGSTATVQDSTFTGNKADGDGGGLLSFDATVDLTNTTFDSNSAGGGGGISNAATATLTDCTLSGNTATNSGGGILNHDTGVLTVNHSTLCGNSASDPGLSAGYGGGIENNGTLHLDGSTLSSNTALYNGGGIENWEGELTVTNCTFTSHSANAGGAINNNWYSSLTVTDSTFRENSANAGGGIYNDNDSSAELNSSTFVANSAVDTTGGGISNAWGMLTLNNCTFSGNTAASYGGGLNNHRGTLTLTNATFSSNSSGGGGGIFNGTLGTLNYHNTIIAGSTSGGDCVNDGAIGDNINNLVEDDTCGAALSGDPGLDSLADNGGPTKTHAFLPGSQAIDAGDDTTCLATDQRGMTRPADGDASGAAACDIGAFELGGLQCGIQAAGESADYLFLGDVKLKVSDDGTDLDCLRVTDIPFNHPNATTLLQTGKYWQIRALTSDHSTAATADYTVDLTLPYDTADADDTACRYSGSDWDCAATSYVANTSVTRAGNSQLSDWAVGSGACAAAVQPDPDISRIGVQNHDALLSWADDPANVGGYQVHRSTSPYFTPGAGTLLATRPAGATSYTDAGAAGSAGVSYTYIVRGLSNCGVPSAYSQRPGVFSFGLVPGQ